VTYRDQSAAKRSLYQRRKDLGLCPRCGGKRERPDRICCVKCNRQPRDKSKTADMSDAELEALIADRRETMPPDGQGVSLRITRERLVKLLSGGDRLTALQIARRSNITTRAVQQVVCNAVRNTQDRYLGRVMDGREYRYFLRETS